jgi:hypothetical protein
MKFEYNGHLNEMNRFISVAKEIVDYFPDIPMEKAMKIAALEDVITTECDSNMYFKRLYNILYIMQEEKNVFNIVLNELITTFKNFSGELDIIIIKFLEEALKYDKGERINFPIIDEF